MTVIFLGDSLFDIGNLTTLAQSSGVQPFPPPFYNQGKASNGQVLSEAIASLIHISPELLIGNSMVTTSPNPLEDNVVYAIAGATTGVFGSAGNNLEEFPIGLASQVESFLNNLPTTNSNNQTIEVFISAGSNDVFEVLVNNQSFVNILLTPETEDNETLINNTANNIINNISQAINLIENKTENISVVTLAPLGNTPFAIKTDQQIDNSTPLDLAGQTSATLNSIASRVNQELTNIFDNQINNNPKVDIIDGIKVFNNAINARQNDLTTPLIKDISYLDYVSGETDLEANLPVEQFVFLDGSHPTSIFNQYLAEEIIPQPQLNEVIYRFQNTNIAGTYLYVGEEEKQNVIANYPNFVEEGIAFYVSSQPHDDLITIYRFQNTDIAGTYLYVAEEERQSILKNYDNFSEEGIAFYVYGADSNKADNIYRFQNQNLPGTYLYVGEEERQNILTNFSNFKEEGIAFEALI